jgi:hypothetical protein
MTSREPAPLPESHGAVDAQETIPLHVVGTSPDDPMKAGDDAVSDDHDGFEYIGLADGPDDLPEYEDVRDRPRRHTPNLSTVREIRDGDRVFTEKMPEWPDEFRRAVEWYERPAPPWPTDDEVLREAADRNDAIKTSVAAVMQGISDPVLRLEADEALAEALRAQPRWVARPTGRSAPGWGAELVLTPDGYDLESSDGEERTESGLTIVRDNPATRGRSRRDRALDLEQAVQATVLLMGADAHQPTEKDVWITVANAEVMHWSTIRSRWRRAAGQPITIGEVREIAKERAPILHLRKSSTDAVQ